MKFKKHKYIFFLLIFILIIIFLFYKKHSTIQLSNTNSNLPKNNPFEIEKILIYSNILCVDNSEFQKPVFNINLHQFSDIAIYFNKPNNLKDENLIKKMYIDNFKFENFKLGTQSIYLKDKNNFGIFSEENIKDSESTLNYKITLKNSEKNDTNTFYYDFSEPIIFEFANQNILENYIIKDQEKKISFDSTILSNLEIPKEYILSGTISFDIHIINNLNTHYINTVSINSFLENDNASIYDGSVYKTISNEFIKQGGFYEFRDN